MSDKKTEPKLTEEQIEQVKKMFTLEVVDKVPFKAIPISGFVVKDDILRPKCGAFTFQHWAIPMAHKDMTNIAAETLNFQIQKCIEKKMHCKIKMMNQEIHFRCVDGITALIAGLILKSIDLALVAFNWVKGILVITWNNMKAIWNKNKGILAVSKSIHAQFTPDELKRLDALKISVVKI